MRYAIHIRRLAALCFLLVTLTSVFFIGLGDSIAGDGSVNPPINTPELPGTPPPDTTGTDTTSSGPSN